MKFTRGHTVLDGSKEHPRSVIKDIRAALHDGVYSHGTNKYIPIITTSPRKRTYLPHCLRSLEEAGMRGPVIVFDYELIGPAPAFLQALKIANSISIEEGPGDYLGFIFLQDDGWVDPKLCPMLKAWWPGSCVLSLYRTIPVQDNPEGSEWGGCKILFSRGISEQDRVNGGVGLLIGSQLIQRLITRLPTDLPVPQAVYNAYDEYHYQTAENLVHHMGAVSAIKDRPEEHRMPVPDWLMGKVHELDKEFGLSYKGLTDA